MRHLASKIATAAFVIMAATGVAIPSAGAVGTTVKPPHNLKWVSPPSISDNVPVRFASKTPCPDVRPDGTPVKGRRVVTVFVTFQAGGGFGDTGPVAADGSWKFWRKLDAGGTQDLHATVTAACAELANHTGIVLANYRPHAITVNP